jgi:hypothetical protein
LVTRIRTTISLGYVFVIIYTTLFVLIDNISKRIEFKTAILYKKRNLLFHEGETPSLLNSYVSILQKLLLDMILITVFGINFPPRE